VSRLPRRLAAWTPGALAGARRVVLFAVLGAGALACAEEEPPAPLPPRPVKMVQVGGGASGTLDFPGEIRPARQADMAFEVPGKIVSFPAQEGARVEEGEILARLDPRDFEAELAKQKAQLDKTQTDLERYRTLFREGVSPRAEFERAQRNYEAARANYQQARKAVEDTELRAPFEGVVARKLVEDFVNVQAKEPVLILQDDSSLEIRVNVPERDFARMTPGVPPEERNRRADPRVVVSALGDRRFPARITEVATTADPQTRTYQARFAFENPPDVNVLPGMTARVVVDTAGSEPGGAEMHVPVQAVVSDTERDPFVWVVDPDTMQVSRAPVELGRMTGDRVVIRAGLEPGQTVAISGVHDLREGAQVRRFER